MGNFDDMFGSASEALKEVHGEAVTFYPGDGSAAVEIAGALVSRGDAEEVSGGDGRRLPRWAVVEIEAADLAAAGVTGEPSGKDRAGFDGVVWDLQLLKVEHGWASWRASRPEVVERGQGSYRRRG